MLSAGDIAPDFTLPDQDGRPLCLAQLRGGVVVLFFYPKAGTPGCTTQVCGVRDNRDAYRDRGAVVVGISPDPVAAVKRFHERQGLDFPLLADEDHAVAEQYGVWVRKRMYGREYMGVQRATFVIDARGGVMAVLPKVSPSTHDSEVLALLDRLAG